MNPAIPPTHPWSHESLYSKALLYVQRMEIHPPEDDQFAFWSALALELLGRAALASISPVLISDSSNWRNISYALGSDPTAKKFTPNSIITNEVFGRLKELLPSFSNEVAGFCVQHLGRRNSELHTGELAYAELGTQEWLPRYYEACSILLSSMSKSLADFVSDHETAESMIESLRDAAANAVQKDINAHAQVWSNKSGEERDQEMAKSELWASRQLGHRVTCPSCTCIGLLQGSPTGTVTKEVLENDVVERQTMLPSSFVCNSCGLRISGLSKLSAAGLGNAFTARSTYSAAEYFGLYTEDDLQEARDDDGPPDEDFNEYY